jgi:hypothetical protein
MITIPVCRITSGGSGRKALETILFRQEPESCKLRVKAGFKQFIFIELILYKGYLKYLYHFRLSCLILLTFICALGLKA